MKNKIDPELVAVAAIDWSMCATAGIIDGAAATMLCKVIDLAKLPKILKPIVWFGVMSFGTWQAIKCFDISKEIVDFGKTVIKCAKRSYNGDCSCNGDCDHCVENENEEENTINGQIGFRI